MEERGRICCGNLAKSGQTRGDHTVNTFQISGNVMATYNLGQQDIVIRDTSTKVHDGKYHVVRFIRTGVNSTLQVDDNQVKWIKLFLRTVADLERFLANFYAWERISAK